MLLKVKKVSLSLSLNKVHFRANKCRILFIYLFYIGQHIGQDTERQHHRNGSDYVTKSREERRGEKRR